MRGCLMTIVVTGATGTVGGLVVRELVEAGHKVRAVTRNPGAAVLPESVEVVGADLEEPESLAGAFAGAEKLFLLSHPDTAVAVARLAEQSGIGRIVTLTSRLAELEEPGALHHQVVEQAVEAVGVEWTHVRPGLFAANLLGWAGAISQGETVREPYADSAQTPIHEADVAAVAVAALVREGHAGKRYPLSGPQVLTKPEQLAAIGAGIGRDLAFEEISPKDWRAAQADSLPEFVQDFLLDIWAGTAANPERVVSTVAEVTGRPARSLSEWAADHAADFGGAAK
ncbi:NAD(P)H-binding protein [Nocardia sp. NPDC051030]|uniref:NmrA family NAD(P)-binding protein n=1 Tax=Nocardia sp. NPDC051030 TaxID=3155162 RepID=UPI00342A70D8